MYQKSSLGKNPTRRSSERISEGDPNRLKLQKVNGEELFQEGVEVDTWRIAHLVADGRLTPPIFPKAEILEEYKCDFQKMKNEFLVLVYLRASSSESSYTF
ncbi:hypothetical protein H5410_047846 [Solanum commersonii]|uniref:Uncharacterized protein n=1 Tax=Solanum commersonii TaxID=4109 RepID=A0A9J5XJG1_SOLCO|nr:hypothetical protein H5410_047846 [Solanum commersonii]